MKQCKVKGQVFTLLASNGNEQFVRILREELHQFSVGWSNLKVYRPTSNKTLLTLNFL